MRHILFSLFVAVGIAHAQSYVVVPSAQDLTDGNSHLWVAGAGSDVRQMTLIGAGHLGALMGETITAIELRRSAGPTGFQGGAADLQVTLSTSPLTPLTASEFFAQNEGADAVPVFQGTVTIPASPPDPGPVMAWSPANVIRIPLAIPFACQPGTLCVDIVGTVRAGQAVDWWLADAVGDPTQGQVASIGPGCGSRTNGAGDWSFVAPGTLVPGMQARFFAVGPANSLAVIAFGARAGTSLPLSLFGVPTPGCQLHLDPNGMLTSSITVFAPRQSPLFPTSEGRADYLLGIPAQSWVFGTQLAAQWYDLAQSATSNGLEWTIASSLPSLDMTLVEGHPQETRGQANTCLAHVFRFEHQ